MAAGEEGANSEAGKLGAAPTWIIDPIDGTNNFVRRFPFTCVSIGLALGGRLVLGVVYCPLMGGLLFSAARGGGAYLNGERIRTSGCDCLRDAAVATEMGYDRSEEGKALALGRLGRLVDSSTQSFRMTGSCAMDMCHVACGRLDSYYEGRDKSFGPKAWDVAATTVIIEEAGGVVSAIEGGALDIFSGRVSCSATPELHEQLLAALRAPAG